MKKRSLTLGTLLAGLSIVAGVAFLLLSGCAAIRQTLNIENPRYSIRDVRPRVDIAIPLSASSIDVNFAIEVDNPNSVGLHLDQIDFNLFVNDTRVLDSISQQDVRIEFRLPRIAQPAVFVNHACPFQRLLCRPRRPYRTWPSKRVFRSVGLDFCQGKAVRSDE